MKQQEISKRFSDAMQGYSTEQVKTTRDGNIITQYITIDGVVYERIIKAEEWKPVPHILD